MKKLGSNSPCASIKSSLLPWSKAIKPQKWGWVVSQPSLSLPRMKNFRSNSPGASVKSSLLPWSKAIKPQKWRWLLRMWHHMTTRQVCPFQYHSLIYIYIYKFVIKTKYSMNFFYKLINYNYFIFKFHIIDY